MPHEPKRRHSIARKGKRRASIKLTLVSVTKCANCGETREFHTVCKHCGFYKNQSVVAQKSKTSISNA